MERKRLADEGSWGGVVPIPDPERPGFGIEGKSEYPVYDKVLSLANDIFDQHGPGCLELIYQRGIYDSSWFNENNIVRLMEPRISINYCDPPKYGFVDLEVDGCYVFELKIGEPTEYRVTKHRMQLEKYLRAYALNHHVIERAALVYFTKTGVVVVEVYCHWIFLAAENNPVTATPLSLVPTET